MADRILVYGVTGSGKTTLAGRLARRTGIPWYSVDDLTWEPGWTAVPLGEQRRRIAAICAGERWILDTAYGKWLDIPLARVQLIVALDYPRWVSLGWLVWRTFLRAADRSEICNGNTESLRQAFSRDSIVVWHFRSFARKRARMRAWAADPAGPAVVRLTSPRATRRWLGTFALACQCFINFCLVMSAGSGRPGGSGGPGGCTAPGGEAMPGGPALRLTRTSARPCRGGRRSR